LPAFSSSGKTTVPTDAGTKWVDAVASARRARPSSLSPQKGRLDGCAGEVDYIVDEKPTAPSAVEPPLDLCRAEDGSVLRAGCLRVKLVGESV
jgi:hypothetical protein